ncbi:hypothetical protein FBU30_004737 [Linnemannia zychae]|nr:hypothetical protein FBU30_004737 [Linnemannia zychae]
MASFCKSSATKFASVATRMSSSSTAMTTRTPSTRAAMHAASARSCSRGLSGFTSCHHTRFNISSLSSSRLVAAPLSAVRVSHFHSSFISSSSKDSKATTKRPETRPCWKCSTPVPYLSLQCTNPDCKAVQTPAPGANYFEVLGLSSEPNFDIDLKDLRLKFFKIQQLIHPDSYSQNTNGDQVYAQQQSSLANKAYSTLKEPLHRANYMLDLSGAPINETEKLDESELLMEVMEARELLEEAQTEDEVQELKSVNDARIKDAVAGLSKSFKENDLGQAKTLAIELQYWIRIQNVIRDWVAGHPIVSDHV